jgi:hypothetical protein
LKAFLFLEAVMKMKRFCGLMLAMILAMGAWAQSRDPHIGYVYPAGGQRGTTFEATISGQYLANASAVYVSGVGVTFKIVEQERQLTPKEQTELKETLGKLQEKRKLGQFLTPEELKSAEEIKKRLTQFGRRLANPALGEFITVQVTVAPDAELGNREIRLLAMPGLSNPLIFNVGDLPEVSKKVWMNVPKSKFSMEPVLDAKPPEKTIVLPATVNGQIPPGGVDRYRFAATAAQQLVVMVRARELIPYIADAVPGWFQATVALYDAKGKEVAYTDDYRFHPDPVLFYKIPAAGEYVLEVKDALYRGREDFVYRITAGELPFVTSIFPLGGPAGTQPRMTVTGWNLPVTQLTLDLRNKAAGLYPLSRKQMVNAVPIAIDTLPECLEKEPNNTVNTAQAVTLPSIVNGRIDQPGDMDVFRFDGQAGDQIVAEVYARRLDSPLDSLLIVTDAAGKQLAFNDDHEDKGSGLNTHHADSYLMLTLPAAGAYFVQIGDTQHGGGGAYGYRLRISPPRPDFELRTTPASLTVRGGASIPMTVYALRKDGFSGPISLRLKDAPPKFSLTNARIPEKQDQARFTLNVPPATAQEPLDLHIEGRATIAGRDMIRLAVPAEDMMQSFAYRHLVAVQEQKLAIVGRVKTWDVARIVSPTPIKIPAGGTATVHASLPLSMSLVKPEFELSEPPEGISIGKVTLVNGGVDLLLQAETAKAKPGGKGNLIIKVTGERPGAAKGKDIPAALRRIPLGALPAISFEVVQPQNP